MMSAKSFSAAIRAKKKKMEEEHSGAVKLSGIPEDAIDILIEKMKEPGEELSENIPKDHSEDPASMEEEAKSGGHDEEAPDPHQINQPEDGPEKEERKAKIRKMMARMSK